MSTVDRALSILRFFTSEKPEWTVEEAAQAMGLPTSTVYRYFRSLNESGLIVNFASGRYVLGPAIIELDRQTRLLDPLIVVAETVLDEMPLLSLSSQVESVGLLCRIYGLQVMCVQQRSASRSDMSLSYERGRPMPLYRGSPSKIILAHLDRRILRRCYKQDSEEIDRLGLGKSWRDFLDSLRKLRRDGYCVTSEELDRGAVGASSPIFGPDGEVIASLSMVMPKDKVDDHTLANAIEQIRESAAETTRRLKTHARGKTC